MDDIFYLSPVKLNIDCMCKIFQNVDSIYVESFRLSGVIQINTGRQLINMALMGALEFDKSDQEFIQTYLFLMQQIFHHFPIRDFRTWLFCRSE